MSQNRPQLTFGELVKVVLELKEDFQKHKQLVSRLLSNKVDKPVKKRLEHEDILPLQTESSIHIQSSENKTLNSAPNLKRTKEKIDIHRDLIKIEKDLLEFHEDKTETIKPCINDRNSKKSKRRVDNSKQNKSQKAKDESPIVSIHDSFTSQVKLEPKLEVSEEENLPAPEAKSHIELAGSGKKRTKKITKTAVAVSSAETDNRKRSKRRRKPIPMEREPSYDSHSSNESNTASEEALGPKEKMKKKDTEKKSKKLYCKCQSAASDDMIQCDHCDQWFHFPCVGIPDEFASIASWFCEDCFLSLNKGSVELCICGEWFEADHELVRCRNQACLKFCHPSCLNLDSEEEVSHWEEAGALCGFCDSNK